MWYSFKDGVTYWWKDEGVSFEMVWQYAKERRVTNVLVRRGDLFQVGGMKSGTCNICSKMGWLIDEKIRESC